MECKNCRATWSINSEMAETLIDCPFCNENLANSEMKAREEKLAVERLKSADEHIEKHHQLLKVLWHSCQDLQ